MRAAGIGLAGARGRLWRTGIGPSRARRTGRAWVRLARAGIGRHPTMVMMVLRRLWRTGVHRRGARRGTGGRSIGGRCAGKRHRGAQRQHRFGVLLHCVSFRSWRSASQRQPSPALPLCHRLREHRAKGYVPARNDRRTSNVPAYEWLMSCNRCRFGAADSDWFRSCKRRSNRRPLAEAMHGTRGTRRTRHRHPLAWLPDSGRRSAGKSRHLHGVLLPYSTWSARCLIWTLPSQQERTPKASEKYEPKHRARLPDENHQACILQMEQP